MLYIKYLYLIIINPSLGVKYITQRHKLNKTQLNAKELDKLLGNDKPNNEQIVEQYRITDTSDGNINIQVLQGDILK